MKAALHHAGTPAAHVVMDEAGLEALHRREVIEFAVDEVEATRQPPQLPDGTVGNLAALPLFPEGRCPCVRLDAFRTGTAPADGIERQ